MSIFVWSMAGIALWHFAIFVPDRFAGGIVGALVGAWAGAMASGFVLDGLSISGDNPPGLDHALYALPGSVLGLAITYVLGVRTLRRTGRERVRDEA